MSKPKKQPDDTPLEHHWICEGCQTVNVGVDPPDLCRICEHEFFENLADLCEDHAARYA